MGDDSDKPESGAGEPKPPQIKAEDNPWYLLATLYGVPEEDDDELREKNRIAWNRYFARMLDRETHARFVEEKHHHEEELTPFSSKELRHVAEAFAQRRGAATSIELPTNNLPVNFSNVEFCGHVAFKDYIFILATFENSTFPVGASFTNTIFPLGASFNNAAFFGRSEFADATFNGEATFSSAAFDGEVRFSGAIFSGLVSFGSATFTEWVTFNRATFRRSAIFGQLIGVERPLFGAVCDKATFFGNGADFAGANFAKKVTFRNATFSGLSLDGAKFDQATFSDLAIFGGTTFNCDATFRGAMLTYMAGFKGATFVKQANFVKATLSQTTFERTTFSGEAEFNNTVFPDHAIFAGAKFEGPSSFVNAEMNGETSFEGAIFKTEPPSFFGATLHQGTVWRGITWPPKPKDKKEAGEFIDAYACLKLEMDRLKKHEDELDFFALELQSRRVLQESVLKGSGLPIALYGALSDYGRNYARPLYALLAVAAVGTLVLLLSGAIGFWQSLGLSIANTFNVFGFRKDFFDAATIEGLPAILKILAALQTIFGTILLFLFGLGVRNKFRMK